MKQQHGDQANTDLSMTENPLKTQSPELNHPSEDPPPKPYREFTINADLVNDMKNFESNYVRTTKYTILTYLPKSLILQFLRLANIYFLFICILECIPAISPLNPITAIFPLSFVLLVSIIREGIEDYRRYLDDKKANSQPVRVLRNHSDPNVGFLDEKRRAIKDEFKDFDIQFPDCFDIIKSQDLKVGQVVLMYEDETFPADLILLGTSDKDGKAYIETAMLDGEKSLKKRVTEKEINPLCSKDRFIFHAKVICQKPTHALDIFGASILGRTIKSVVTDKQLLMKGAKLKNTKWVTAVVAFAGAQTKLLLNTNKGRNKQSRIERIMNQLIVFILGIQMIICIIQAIIAFMWQAKKSENHYYLQEERSASWVGFISFFSYFLLLNTLIPISLVVTLEIVKFMQLFFMQWDVFMYKNGYFAKVSTCTINEELGQVRYIFSDKTGTLTCNKMELKGIRVYSKCYGEKMLNTPEEPAITRGKTKKVTTDLEFSFVDKELDFLLRNKTPENAKDLYQIFTKTKQIHEWNTEKDRVYEFLKLLACCHEVAGTKPKGSNYFVYAGQSPDEVCLVDAAQRIGAVFVDNRNNILNLNIGPPDENPKEIKVELLNTFPFDSARARMSVIIRDENNKVKLYCKGSDERVIDLLHNKTDVQMDPILKETNEYLANAASKGLRTLYMAMKVIDDQEYDNWRKRMDTVNIWVPSNDKEEKEKKFKINELIKEIEKDLFYLGCTVVEDKLQENVENTIHNLGKAGVQVWMITGDKMGTAKSIGYSCKMFTKGDMEIIQIDEDFYNPKTTELNEQKVLSKIKEAQFITNKKIGLLITGMLVEKLVNNEVTKHDFVEFAKKCSAVVCCRTTANQKAEVVKAMKEACPGEITLSIGDGGNDVPMINEAHVGVGIYGKEGMQAAQSADYAIGEFQCLWNLLMVHGRLAYLRISELILYFFYKNAVFTLPQLYYSFWCAHSGQSYYDSWYISFYNLFFTSLPLLFKALYEHDIHHIQDRKMPLNNIYPYMYFTGQGNEIFNLKKIAIWFAYGIFHSTIAFFIPFGILQSSILSQNGEIANLWIYSVTSFTCVVVIVNVKLYTTMRYFTWINVLSIAGLSIGIYIIAQWISNYVSMFTTINSILIAYKSPIYFFIIILCVMLVAVIDHFIQLWSYHMNTSTSDFCRNWAAYYDPLDTEINNNNFIRLKCLDSNTRKANKGQNS